MFHIHDTNDANSKAKGEYIGTMCGTAQAATQRKETADFICS
jgi:hypothetical protein